MSPTGPMRGLATLRSQMEEREWAIVCLPFTYASNDYFVLVRRYLPPADRKPPKALVELCFVNRKDTNQTLTVDANSWKLFATVKALREYFDVAFDAVAQGFPTGLYESFGNQLPSRLPETLPAEAQQLVLRQLSRSDSEDPNKLYCTHVRRNRHPQVRTAYNGQKTQLLRPALFDRLRNEPGLSFCYSTDPEASNDDATILSRLTRSQGA